MQRFGGRLAGAARERGNAGVDDVGARLGGLDVGHLGDAGRGVGVHLDGLGDARLLNAAHQVISIGGCKVASHVLDADGVGTEAGHLLGELHEVRHRVHGARGVGDGALALAAGLLAGLDRGLEVAHVVERVEHAHHVDAVFDGLLHHGAHHVVGVVLVAQKVLAAQQHLQLGVVHVRTDGAQALPRVLVEEAQAGVERGAAPHLDGVEAGAVHRLQDGQHVLDGHARGNLALLAVAQDGLHDADMAGGDASGGPGSTGGSVRSHPALVNFRVRGQEARLTLVRIRHHSPFLVGKSRVSTREAT